MDKRSKDMSKYEFLPGDKVLIKGREDSGEWIVVESHPRNATVTLAALGSRTVVDKTDLIRIPSTTTASEPCWLQVGDVKLYPECPPTKTTTLQLEVDNARLKEKIAHLDDSIDHQDKVIEDLRRKTLLYAGEIDAQRDTIREQRQRLLNEYSCRDEARALAARIQEKKVGARMQRRINERECRGPGPGNYIRAFLGEEL